MEDLPAAIAAALRGDPHAYRALLERYQDTTYALAYARLGDHDAAEDAAQSAFIEAFLSLPRLREPAAFPGWLRQIVVHQCSRMTRGRRWETVPLEQAAGVAGTGGDPAAALEAALEAAEARRIVYAALASLTDLQREAVLLFHLQGCSYREAGEALGVPVGTVKKRLHSGRSRLRERMVAMLGDDLDARKPSRDEVFTLTVELGAAAARGETERVAELLRTHPEGLDSQDRYGDTALGRAARGGHVEVVRLLLEHGATPGVTRTVRDGGWSPLFWACEARCRPEIVRLLLEHGADPGARAQHHGASEDTVLHSCARWGHVVAAEILLAHGADRDARCGDGDYGQAGMTPLQVAARRGHGEFVDMLLRHGAVLDPFSAAGLGRLERLRELAGDEWLSATDGTGATPLHWAAAGRQHAAVEYLLDRGAEPNAADSAGRTPLVLAALSGDPALPALLRSRGAVPDLFAAALLGDLGRLSELAADPAALGARSGGRRTALHWAARGGREEVIRWLLDGGAEIDARDAGGRSPLFVAAYEAKDLGAVRLLVERGADVTVRDEAGRGLLAYDVGPEVYTFLKARGAAG